MRLSDSRRAASDSGPLLAAARGLSAARAVASNFFNVIVFLLVGQGLFPNMVTRWFSGLPDPRFCRSIGKLSPVSAWLRSVWLTSVSLPSSCRRDRYSAPHRTSPGRPGVAARRCSPLWSTGGPSPRGRGSRKGLQGRALPTGFIRTRAGAFPWTLNRPSRRIMLVNLGPSPPRLALLVHRRMLHAVHPTRWPANPPACSALADDEVVFVGDGLAPYVVGRGRQVAE